MVVPLYKGKDNKKTMVKFTAFTQLVICHKIVIDNVKISTELPVF